MKIIQMIWSKSSDLTRVPRAPKGSVLERKWDPLFQENPGWWNIIIWPEMIDSRAFFKQLGAFFYLKQPFKRHAIGSFI